MSENELREQAAFAFNQWEETPEKEKEENESSNLLDDAPTEKIRKESQEEKVRFSSICEIFFYSKIIHIK